MSKNKNYKLIGIALVAAAILLVIIGKISSSYKEKHIEETSTDIFGDTLTETPTGSDTTRDVFSDILSSVTATEAEEKSTSRFTVSSTLSTTAGNPSTSAAPYSSSTTSVTEGNTYAYAYAGFDPVPADLNVSDWTLILVNRDYILPDGFKPELEVTVAGSGVQLDSRVAPHYREMYDAAKADGITLTPVSGYRRWSTQKTNFENKINYYESQGYSKAQATQLAAQIILPPGTSEHNAGLAMDICSLDVDFETSKEFDWLCKNAEDYGFILRYPEEKTDITKITYEPWHWRYVGVEHAKEINSRGICLEEYLGKY